MIAGPLLAGVRIAGVRVAGVRVAGVGVAGVGVAGVGVLACLAAGPGAALWPGAASAQLTLPPAAGESAAPPATFGPSRSLPPQVPSLAPAYKPPPSSPAMPIPPMITAPPAMPVPAIGGGAQSVPLSLIARFGSGAAPIQNGLIWRIFPSKPDGSGTFRLVREERTASPVVPLPTGDYVVHVSFGMVSVARPVHLTGGEVQVFELPAGGIKLEGRVGDAKIAASAITFDIFKGSQFEQGSKVPLAQGVQTDDVVVVPEGNYYIVSNYGDTNAVVQSDIRVQTGKLTEVTVNHRAAEITLKLVGARGGDAIASTTWSVITPGGDLIKESTGIFPRMVLAEGEYRAIARNEGRTYERTFKVVTGVDGEVEVLAR